MIIVNDVTTLNPRSVSKIFKPSTQQELISFIQKNHKEQLEVQYSIAGGRFSMGGQSSVDNTVNIDMTGLNKIVDFLPEEKIITVEAGCIWRDIQKIIDSKDLSIKIMQTYSNFTVGGSLSVNVHGRYIGLGPIILSVKKIKVLMVDGSVVYASNEENSEIFNACIGCYGAIGLILEATLSLADNERVKQQSKRMDCVDYLNYFKTEIRENPDVVFHNADIYPTDYEHINAVSWVKTQEPVTILNRLIPKNDTYHLQRYFIWAFTETPWGKLRRKHIYEPLFYRKKRIYHRNYEASYDANELEPESREDSTYVLQEYFIPFEKINEFLPQMAEIYNRYNVNVLNISIRHAKEDSGSLLAWAKEEMFCFVVYYKQYKNQTDSLKTPIWTRELITLANKMNGSYYLPYQPHATYEQFSNIYKNKDALFALKKKLDPKFQLRNSLWDKYYANYLSPQSMIAYERESQFSMLTSDMWHDKTYQFLQNIFGIQDCDKYFQFLNDVYLENPTLKTSELYSLMKERMGEVTSFMDNIRALKSLKKQKKIMKEQVETYNLQNVHSYMEMGTTGRYVNGIKSAVNKQSKGSIRDICLLHNAPPSSSVIDMVDRGSVTSEAKFVNINTFVSIKDQYSNRFDLVTCFIGLHHFPKDKLDGYVSALAQSIKVGGHFILRDHDCETQEMKVFASLIHSIFNLGTNETPETDHREVRNFEGLGFWITLLEKHGLSKVDVTQYQQNDPSLNALMLFKKTK